MHSVLHLVFFHSMLYFENTSLFAYIEITHSVSRAGGCSVLEMEQGLFSQFSTVLTEGCF